MVVHGNISKLAELNRKLPTHVFMSLDNSAGQNLNSGVMAFSPNEADHAMLQACVSQPTIVPEYSDQEVIGMCFSARAGPRTGVERNVLHQSRRQ